MRYVKKSTKFQSRENRDLTANNRPSGAGGPLRAVAADQLGEEVSSPSNNLRHGHHLFVWCRLPSPASQKRPILQTNEQREKRPLVGGHGGRRGLLSHAQST